MTVACSSLLPHGPHDIAGGGRCDGCDPRAPVQPHIRLEPADSEPGRAPWPGPRRCTSAAPRLVGSMPPPLCWLPAGHAGRHEDRSGLTWERLQPFEGDGELAESAELPAGPGLSAGQEIRVRAVEAAARLCAARTTTPLSYVADEILDLAARLTAFIATREGEVSDEDVSAG